MSSDVRVVINGIECVVPAVYSVADDVSNAILDAIKNQGGGVVVRDSAGYLFWMVTDDQNNEVKFYIFGTTTIGEPSLPIKPFVYEMGTMEVTALPDVTIASMPHVTIDSLPNITVNELPAGTNNIGKVDINSLPSVTISSIPHVTVDSLPNITIQSMPNVTIDYLPSIDIHSMPSVTGTVSVDSLPSVTISSLPHITVDSLPSVTIQTMPSVTIQSMPNVVVSTLPTISLGASSNTIGVVKQQSVSAAGTLASSGGTVLIDCTNMCSASFFVTGTFSGTLNLWYTLDGGVTFNVLPFWSASVTGNPSVITAISSTTSLTATYNAELPAGATQLKLFMSPYTSGSASVVLSASAVPHGSIPTMLTSSSVVIGQVRSAEINYTDTTTALGASSTFTSSFRDCTSNSSGVTAFTPFNQVNISVYQNVTFTLQVEYSTDGVTGYQFKSITPTAVGSGFVAEVQIPVAWRYIRYKIINGASAASTTIGCSTLVS